MPFDFFPIILLRLNIFVPKSCTWFYFRWENFKLEKVIYLGLKHDQQWISLIIYICRSLSELQGLLRPWYYAVKFLKEIDCSSAWWPIRFSLKNFICPHKEAAPHRAKEYAPACRGEVPARFIFAWTKNRLWKLVTVCETTEFTLVVLSW